MATPTERGDGAKTPEILKGLNDLLQLDHDAIGAYDIAIEKLEDQDHADQIRGFKNDHERHIRDLNDLITSLGGSPTNEPHTTGPFKEALQSLGGVAGDRGVLTAFRTNELQVRTKYDNYASKATEWPEGIKRVIDRNALDEERHYRWVADTLQRMGVGMGEGPEIDLASKTREGAARVSSKVSGAADQARSRAADGLDSAARKLDDLGSKQESAGGARAKAGAAAHRVADTLESAAGNLRSPGGGGGIDIEEQVRANPLQTLLVSFAAGIVLGRILR